jgi:quercetin dioxygenase-like cupin family protein
MIKFRDARGLRLFRWGKFQIEYWSFPPGFRIEKHSHPNQHIETMVISGSAHFYRQTPGIEIIDNEYVETPADRFKKYSIPPGYFHWFDVGPDG